MPSFFRRIILSFYCLFVFIPFAFSQEETLSYTNKILSGKLHCLSNNLIIVKSNGCAHPLLQDNHKGKNRYDEKNYQK